MRRIDRAFLAGKLDHRYSSASVETLQRRIAYGGRKGQKAAKRVAFMSRFFATDRAELRAHFGVGVPKVRALAERAPLSKMIPDTLRCPHCEEPWIDCPHPLENP